MTPDPWSSAAAIARDVRAGTLSAAAVVEAALRTIAARNPALNAFTDVVLARAQARAAALDRGTAPRGPLAGVPFAVKNLSTSRASSRAPAAVSTATIRPPRRTRR